MIQWFARAGAGLALSAGMAGAAPVYLNVDNISVALGKGTSVGALNNTFSLGSDLGKVIDAPSADALERHDQETHIWFTAPKPGDLLELVFDLGRAYDIRSLHFWNYTAEEHDVDEITFDFRGPEGEIIASQTIRPALGSAPGIAAQDVPLKAPFNVRYITARLGGSNGEVDFQNIGFTAEPSVPPP